MKSINELTVNQSTETETSLLHAWLEIVKNSNEVAMSGFLQALYSRLEWKQSALIQLNGWQRDSKHDLCLMAIMKLASGLFTGNQQLMVTTHIFFLITPGTLPCTLAGVRDDMANQLERCCNAALKYAVREIRRQEVRRREKSEKIHQALIELCQMNATNNWGNFGCLSVDDKIIIAGNALTKAVKERKITSRSAECRRWFKSGIIVGAKVDSGFQRE